jgi:3-oxoacyl-[acyl-carrier-protein] synthase-3
LSQSNIGGFRIAGVSTCLPPAVVDNLDPTLGFPPEDVRKVVAMAGVRERRVVRPGVTSADLCQRAAERLLQRLGWAPDTVSALVFVTQTPDHFLPSTSCLLQQRLGLPDSCAAFDVGLGCSGYPYGLYIAATLLRGGGHRRVLMLHGETPSRFVSPEDQATVLLFSDAGSATALELDDDPASGGHFVLHTDGSGAEGLILRGGAFRDREPANPRHRFLEMDGAAIFNFTIKRVPALIADTLAFAGKAVADVDAFVFHQSNRFIMKHLMKKGGLPEDRVPFSIEDSGNCGGPSVAVAMTRRLATPAPGQRQLWMLLGYGVGLSWASALVPVDERTVLLHDDGEGL